MVNTNENKKIKEKEIKKNSSKATSNTSLNKNTKKPSTKKNSTNSNKEKTTNPEIITKKVSKNDTKKVSKIVHESNTDINFVETNSQNQKVENTKIKSKKNENDETKNKNIGNNKIKNKNVGNTKFENNKVDNTDVLNKVENKDVSDLEKRLKHAEKNYTKNKIYAEKNKNYPLKLKINNCIYNIIICISLILIIYSSYNILLWHKDNKNNKKLIDEVTNSTPISNVEEVPINENLNIQKKSYDFQNLLSQNPDTVGWISVPNTEINYPVVKGENNEFYLKHSFDKKYNAGGWIYADYRNKCDDTDNNLIIYGHNRLNNNMFGTLENVLKDSWLSEPSNHYINYSSTTKSQIYEIFSTFICKSSTSTEYLNTDFRSKDDYRKYLENIKNKSSYYFDVRVTEDDKIITLYTCHGLNNERLLVFGKLIT